MGVARIAHIRHYTRVTCDETLIALYVEGGGLNANRTYTNVRHELQGRCFFYTQTEDGFILYANNAANKKQPTLEYLVLVFI